MAKGKKATPVNESLDTSKSLDSIGIDALEELITKGGTGLKALGELLKRSQIDWKSETERTAARHALRRSFVALLERDELRRRRALNSDELAALEWLENLYEEHLHDLIDWTWNDASTNSERVAALRTVLLFCSRESLRQDELEASMTEEGNPRSKAYNLEMLQRLLETGMRRPLSSQDLVLRTIREEYSQTYVDFQLHYAKALQAVFNSLRKNKQDDTKDFSINSAFLLLCIAPLPKLKPLEEDEKVTMMVEEDPIQEAKLRKVGPLRKAFQGAWLAFLRLRTLEGATFKSVLTKLPHVIPYLSQPLLLSDFLTDSFSVKTLIGDEDEVPLLALKSLFTLVRDYGLDYPNLYVRLYELVRPSLFHSNHRESFCLLLDASLKSPLLPAYLIAAFCKRLARVALLSSPSAALFALSEVYNLLRRHPNCVFLIHRSERKKSKLLHVDKQEDHANELRDIKEASRRLALGLSASKPSNATDDPFIFNEQDPAKCKATESSLWELESLKHHYCPSVASLARSVFAHDLAKDRLTKPELPLEDFVLSYQDLYSQEARLKRTADGDGGKRVKVDAPLNATKPGDNALGCLLMFSSN